MAIATVMGAPLQDAAKLHHWSNWIQRQFDAVSMAGERDKIEEAVEEFYVYARALVRARRDNPGDDLISKLIEAEEQGEKLDEEECINLVFNVLAGGVDTSQSQLAHAVRLLAEHPDQWAALVDDPALAEQAVEEALRYEPITPFTARILTEEVVFRDVVMPAGHDRDRVRLHGQPGPRRPAVRRRVKCAAAPGGDGEPPADPEAFDITAVRPRARTLTFGAGVHYCLGANLARLEMQEALAFMSTRMRDLALDGEPEYDASPASTASRACRSPSRSEPALDATAPPAPGEHYSQGGTRPQPRQTVEMAVRILQRALAAGPALAAVLVVLGLAGASAQAGQYHVYSCRTPTGLPAPTDGWTGSVAAGGAVDDYALNTCGKGGALVAALGDETKHFPGVDFGTWGFGSPVGATIARATLWRAGDTDGGGDARPPISFGSPGRRTATLSSSAYFRSDAGVRETQHSLCRVRTE